MNYVSLEDDLSANHPCFIDKVSDNSIVYDEQEFYDYIDKYFSDNDKKIIEHKIKGYSYLEISKILGLKQKVLL